LGKGAIIIKGFIVASKGNIEIHSVINRLAVIGHHSTIVDFAFVAMGA
jgi:hypothetical protein